ncbi:MAG: hypothetical protein R3F07_18290 [Opitutaceae bacterium]
MRLITISLHVLLLLLPVRFALADEQADLAFLQASAALDGALIPALIAVREGEASGVGVQLDKVTEAWQAYRSDQLAILKTAPGWAMTRGGMERRLEMAKRFVGNGDVSMARLVLDQMQVDLFRLRQSLGRETFVDRLVGFHEEMESILAETETGRKTNDPESLRKGIEALENSWEAIEAEGVDSAVYGLLWEDATKVKGLIAAESVAIRQLGEAVDRGRDDDLGDLAEAVRTAFRDVVLFFGE